MAYCYKCGAEMSEEDKFCPECGTAVVELGEKKRETAPVNKKVFAIGAAALIVIVAIVVLVLVLKGSGFGSPEKAFEAWFNGNQNHDFDLVLRAEPDFMIKHDGGETEVKKKLQEVYDQLIAESEESGYTAIYDAVGSYTLDKDEAEAVIQHINNEFDVDAKISEVAVVDYKLTVRTKSGMETDPHYDNCGYAIKYKGKWYFINYGPVD